MGTTRKGINLNEKNGLWKGSNVGYVGIHAWVNRHKPKPDLCIRCNKRKAYDLANISQQYKRDINDYEWLCRSCHMKEDGRLQRLNKFKRLKGSESPFWKGGLERFRCLVCNKQISFYSIRCRDHENERRRMS